MTMTVTDVLSWLRLRRRARCGRHVVVRGWLWLHGRGRVEVGDGVILDGGPIGIELHSFPHARIVIGAGCRINPGVSMEALELVQLGERVTIGTGAKIIDNNFHPLRGDQHEPPSSRPVIIEDDVAIGNDAIVLPGVRIQRGARIADGAVVSHLVRSGSTVAGNPARPVRSA